MFGILCPGHNLNVIGQLMSDHEVVLTTPAWTNHVAVFLTGSRPFAQGTGASVYLINRSGGGHIFLGGISNDKPSVIFKIQGECFFD